jgi:hemolysin III
MSNKLDNNFSEAHERANALSHGVGALIVLIMIPIFWFKFESSPALYFSLSLYFFSVLFMLIASTSYHAVRNVALKPKLRVFDHIAIFFVIGGTTLPFVVKYVSSAEAFSFALIQWSLIALGSVLKIFFTGRFRLFSSIIYILIGAMVLTLGPGFWRAMPNFCYYIVLLGGLFYLIGVYFYQNRNIKFNHFIWHLFVLAALFTQATALYHIE